MRLDFKRIRKLTANRKLLNVLSSRNVREFKSRLVKTLTPHEIRANYKSISKSRIGKSALDLYFKEDYQMVSKDNPATKDFLVSFAWAMNVLEYYSDEIKEYVRVKCLIQERVLANDISAATDLIDRVESVVGVSFWSYKLKRSLGLDVGGESPKESGFNSFLMGLVSDFSGAEDCFERDMKTISSEVHHHFSPDIAAYVEYFVVGFAESADFYDYFWIGTESSVVDIYELVVHVLRMAVCSGCDEKKFIRRSVRDISRIFGEKEFLGLRCSAGVESEIMPASEVRDVYDLYTKGDYDAVCYYAMSYGLNRLSFSTCCLVASANSRVDLISSECDVLNFYSDLKNIVLKGGYYASSLARLKWLANKFRGLDWFQQLYFYVLCNEGGVRPLKVDYYNSFILTYCFELTPKYVYSLPSGSVQNRLLIDLNKDWEGSPTLALFGDDNEALLSLLGVDGARARKYSALKMIKLGLDPSEILETLLDDHDVIVRNGARSIYFDYLISCGDILKATNMIVDGLEFCDNEEAFLSGFDIVGLLDRLKLSLNDFSSISIPILFSFYSKYFDFSYEDAMAYSLERFLSVNGYLNIDGVFEKESEYGWFKLYHLLADVCSEKTMSMCLALPISNEDDLSRIRLSICRYLIGKPGVSKNIQDEIRKITRLLVVKDIAKKVAVSRIYVDSAYFYGPASRDLQLLYKHYKEQPVAAIDSEFKSQVEEVVVTLFEELDLKSRGERYFTLSRVHVRGVTGDHFSSFYSFVRAVKSDFTLGRSGLNTYLSTRIRHGVLPTAVRGPIKAEKLYVRNHEDFSHNVADLVLASGEDLSVQECFPVEGVLKSLSDKIEDVIREINDEWLQIVNLIPTGMDQKKNNGLFEYCTSNVEVQYVLSELPVTSSYDEAISVVLRWLWDRTDYNLIQVQRNIREKSAVDIAGAFESAMHGLKECDISNGLKGEIHNSLARCKAAMIKKIEEIAGWFMHQDTDDEKLFDVSVASEISKQTLGLSISECFDCSDEFLTGRELNHWVDIFLILFENSISKSGLSKVDLDIRVVMQQVDGYLHVSVLNRCLLLDSVDVLNERLAVYRDHYGLSGDYTDDAIQREGKTGFYKVWKILEWDLKYSGYTFDFSFKGTGEFEVVLEIPLEG